MRIGIVAQTVKNVNIMLNYTISKGRPCAAHSGILCIYAGNVSRFQGRLAAASGIQYERKINNPDAEHSSKLYIRV